MNSPTKVIQLSDVYKPKESILNRLRSSSFFRSLENLVLVLLPIAWLSFSFIMLYSTSGVMAEENFSDSLFFVKRQFFSAVIGGIACVIFSFTPLRIIKKFSVYLFIISVFLLLCILIPGLGERAGGAQRWLNFLGLRFQPAEFVKLFFVIFIAGYFSRHIDKIKTFSYGIVKPFVCVGILSALLLLQPDFGSSAVIVAITLCLVLLMGAKISHLVYCGTVIAGLMATLVWISPYRMKRFTAFLDPFEDKSGSGYQLIQSLIAVGSGRFTGMGLGSSQQKLFYLPAAHTDFIYAVVAEELGFLGAASVLLSYLLFLWLGMQLAKRLLFDTFAYVLCLGIVLLISLPAFINVGVVTGMLPTKGLVLPLIGYGGTSVMVSLAALGILIGLIKCARKHERLWHDRVKSV
jgi:cell division protein FtsW